MGINNNSLPCHSLMHHHLNNSLSIPIIIKYGSVSMPGHYALVHSRVHSVAENVSKNGPTTLFILQNIKIFG